MGITINDYIEGLMLIAILALGIASGKSSQIVGPRLQPLWRKHELPMV